MTQNPLLDLDAKLVIAHRGNRVRAPENTIESLRQAVDLGADGLEFDVRATRDGVPVLMHDPTLDRTTDATGRVSDFTLAELAAVNAGARMGGPRLSVPTLEETLATFRGIPLVIEVKELTAAEATANLVRRLGLEEQVLVGSAETRVMEWFYRSGLRSCASMHDATRWLPFALTGLRPPKPRFDVLSLTPNFRGLPIPVRALANVARKVGVPTQVWTVNEPDAARRYWQAGIAAIITDDPKTILAARIR